MRPIAVTIAIVALTACAPSYSDDRAIVTLPNDAPPSVVKEDAEPKLADIELCDARDYRPLIGSNVSATTFPRGARLRVFGVNDIVTQDYIPQRTNVVHDEGGRITRVYCG